MYAVRVSGCNSLNSILLSKGNPIISILFRISDYENKNGEYIYHFIGSKFSNIQHHSFTRADNFVRILLISELYNISLRVEKLFFWLD